MIFNSFAFAFGREKCDTENALYKEVTSIIAKFFDLFTFTYNPFLFDFICPLTSQRTFKILKTFRFAGLSPERYIILAMFQYNDYTTDVWLLKLSEQQDPFRFRMHAQRVCIIAAYPVLRLCDAGNIAALSAHDVSNTELPHEFASSLSPHGNSVHNTQRPPSTQSSLSIASRRNGDME